MGTNRLKLFLLLVAASALLAQEPLNNEGIVKLVKSGMTEDLIIRLIQQQPGTYSFGANDLVALKEASISEKVIAAMMDKAKGTPIPAQPASTAPAGVSPSEATPTGAPPGSIAKPGVYYRKGDVHFELLSEPVEWQAKGAMKNALSAGIIKKDLRGVVAGAGSRNFLANPVEILFAPPPGVTVNSYVLLPMKSEGGRRKFDVGPVNRKTGDAKGAIHFGAEKIADDKFRLVLETPLGPGEYGFLELTPAPPATTGTSKMYTFRIM